MIELPELLTKNPHAALDDVAAWGAVILWPGVAEAWFLPGPHVGTRTSELSRLIKAFIQDLKPHHGIRRLHCFVNAQKPANVRLAEHLGFFIEATLPDFGPEGQSYYIMRCNTNGPHDCPSN